MGRNILILLGLVLLLVTACSPTPQATPLVATQLVEPEPIYEVVETTQTTSTALSATPRVEPQRPSLFTYIAYTWTEQYLPIPFGPAIYFIDYEQIRADLGFPAPGETIPSDQAPVLFAAMGRSTQGILPFFDQTPITRSAKEQIGWDVTDVRQALVVPDLQMTLLDGAFDRTAIADALTAGGYRQTTEGKIEIFSPPQFTTTEYLLSPDIIALTDRQENIEILVPMLQAGAQLNGSAADHPTIQMVLGDPARIWGAVFSPSSDMRSASENTRNSLGENPEMLQLLEERFGSLISNVPNWDFMAISFRGIKDAYRIQFVYHYTSPEKATEDQALVRTSLTENPSFVSPNLTWADLVTLQSVEVLGDHIIASGTTQRQNLVADAVGNRDFGFLPIPPSD